MRSADGAGRELRAGLRLCASAAIAAALAFEPAGPAAQHPPLLHKQRYSMGTMFDVMVYHAAAREAEQAVEKALAEIERLDAAMSDYEADSELSRVVREARRGFTKMSPELYAVVEESLRFARASGGKFDVTISPLLGAWRKARQEDRRPTDAELAKARECVGYDKVELAPPDRVRFRSDCVEIDLGGIGKGYAIDRALAILTAAGIQHAMIDGGSSSIASIGNPPRKAGCQSRSGPRARAAARCCSRTPRFRRPCRTAASSIRSPARPPTSRRPSA
jgi:thiamine biosynthesis lipoprotein